MHDRSLYNALVHLYKGKISSVGVERGIKLKIRLIARKLQPKGVPIPLSIQAKVFEGENSTALLEQIKEYVASDVIPVIPFLRLDEPYRRQIRQMSTLELSRMLVNYMNDQQGPSGTQYPVPQSDDEALETMEAMGFLTRESE
jgi:hypothetical protein